MHRGHVEIATILLLSHLLKFIPGGAVAGSAISATVAASLTRAVGVAWAKVCEYALTLPEDQQQAFWSSGAALEKFRSALSAG